MMEEDDDEDDDDEEDYEPRRQQAPVRRPAARRPEPRREPVRPEPAYRDERDYMPADLETESAFGGYAVPEQPARDTRQEEIDRLRAEVETLRRQVSQPARGGYTPGTSAHPAQARVLYMGVANQQGVFTRAEARFNPAASIFTLITTDGVSGSFTVSESPTAQDIALASPSQTVLTACTGQRLADTTGVRSIETVAPGTAIFEDGRWVITRRAQIRYIR